MHNKAAIKKLWSSRKKKVTTARIDQITALLKSASYLQPI